MNALPVSCKHRIAWFYAASALLLSATAVRATPQQMGNMLEFNGRAYYVTMTTNVAALALGDDFTLEAWIKLPAVQAEPHEGRGVILIKGWDPERVLYATTYLLGIQNLDNRLEFSIGDGVSSSQTLIGTSNLGTKQWTHVAAVRSKTSLSVYVNGSCCNRPVFGERRRVW